MQPIGIFGGTFDPIHYGHLRCALELYQQLNLQNVRFIPCQNPVIDKTAHATILQRLTMLKKALADQPSFLLDEREIHRTTPSYSVDTLLSLREEFPHTPLCFIIGSDALNNLHRWHRWQELITLAHLIVITRPKAISPQQRSIQKLIHEHQISDAKQLVQQISGYLFVVDTIQLDISGTMIRQQIAAGLNPRYLLPDEVLQYIRKEKLYCDKI